MALAVAEVAGLVLMLIVGGGMLLWGIDEMLSRRPRRRHKRAQGCLTHPTIMGKKR